MAQSIELVTGTVKYTAGQPRQTQYGERINVLVTLAEGSEQRLWGNPGDAVLTSLRKGQQVQLAKDHKGYKLIADAQQPSNGSNGKGKTWQGWSDEEKRAIAAKVSDHADLLAFCLKTAREKLSSYCQTSEDIRALATTLYLSALKSAVLPGRMSCLGLLKTLTSADRQVRVV